MDYEILFKDLEAYYYGSSTKAINTLWVYYSGENDHAVKNAYLLVMRSICNLTENELVKKDPIKAYELKWLSELKSKIHDEERRLNENRQYC